MRPSLALCLFLHFLDLLTAEKRTEVEVRGFLPGCRVGFRGEFGSAVCPELHEVGMLGQVCRFLEGG